MSKRQILMILGVWVAVLPFLGFPSSWTEIIAVVSGLLIVFIAYSVHPGARQDREQGPYVEHRPLASKPEQQNEVPPSDTQ